MSPRARPSTYNFLALGRRAVENASRTSRGHLAVLERNLPIDDDLRDPFGILMGFLEGRKIPHRERVENRDVGLHSLAQHAAIRKPAPLRRKRGHLADRFLERNRLELSHVTAEHSRERAVAARMRVRLAEDRHLPIRPDHRRRMPEDSLQIVLVDRVEDSLAAALLDDPQHGLGGIVDGRVEAASLRHVAETLAVERVIPIAARELYVLRIAA